MAERTLTSTRNVANLDAFLEHVLSDVKSGSLSISDAKAGLAEIIHLIDNGSDGARLWLEQGRKIIKTEK